MKKFTLTVLSLLCSTVGLLAAVPANGVYEVKHSNRGYLTQNVTANTLHPGDATLGGYTTDDKCVVGRNSNGYQSYWYLYTSETSGNSYIFSASNGMFLAYENGTNSGTLFNLSSTPTPLDIVDATTSGYYQIHAHGVSAVAFSNSIGWGKNVAYRFASVSSDYDGIPHAFVTASGEFDQSVIDTAIAAINSVENATPQVVTFTFPEFGGQTLTMEANVLTGTDASTAVPSVAFFTATGVEETDKVVSTENHAFTVTGDWTFPFEDEEVYRIDIRKKGATDAGTCSNLLYNASANQVDTRVGTDADAFVPERLFYLDAKGFDATGNLKATLHSIAVDANMGFQIATPNKSKGTFTETPVEFLVVTNSAGTDGISLRHPDNNICHVNDINGYLGVWTEARSQNDVGSFLRFGELTDSDFDSLLSGELADYITTDMLNAAKASKSAADVRALFNAAAPYLEAVAEAEALLASISGYTADNFGSGLGYFSGTTYEAIFALAGALQETLEGFDVEAITAATEALAAEVAKVQVNVPVAGKFYRIQNNADDAYLVGGAEVMIAKFESVDAGAPNSIFYFTGDKLVSYTTGLYLANFDRDNNGKMFLGYTNVNGAEVGTSFTFKVASPGKFNVVYNGDRYLYSAGAGNVNAGSGVTTSSPGYQNYCFTLTEVEWLPIAIDEEFGWTTLYSPVQLGFNDRVKAYVGTVNADDPSDLKFVVTELTEAIPANVGVLVQLLEGAQVDNGCVYLPVEESTVTGVTSDLTGSFEKVAVASEVQVADASEIVKSHFVFEKKSDEVNGDFGEFNKNDVDDLAAFAAHLEVDNASDETITIADSEGNNPTTGIEEINVESDKVQGIYDLQGRRLSAPVKGINIINGKKVLVK